MNRNAYIAELTQLLHYMTEWDRSAAVTKYANMLDAAEDPDDLIKEIGTPMKLAVALSRGYTPTPDPSALPVSPAAPTDEETSAAEEPPASEPEVTTTPEPAPMPLEGSEQESPEETQVPEAEEPEETSISEPSPEEGPLPVEEAPPEISDNSHEPIHNHHGVHVDGDEIFSEIFSAATQAQTPIFSESDNAQAVSPKRKPRLGVLIPYVILCVLIGVPVTLLLFAVDLMIFFLALVFVLAGIHILSFLTDTQFVGIGDKLVIIGVSILAFAGAVAIVALAIWFLRNAVLGFLGFLIRFGRKYGYREVDET